MLLSKTKKHKQLIRFLKLVYSNRDPLIASHIILLIHNFDADLKFFICLRFLNVTSL